MKQIQRVVKFLSLLLAIVFTGGLQSCSDIIYDDEEDCTQTYRITFKYDYNMKFADAFASECNSVALYVFDKDGKYIKTYTTTVDELKKTDYYLTLDLEPGSYKFISWCGLDDELKSYAYPAMTAGQSTFTELTNYLKRNDAAVGAIDNLYYGSLDAVLPDEYGIFDYTIDLTKNTNTVQIAIQFLNKAAEPINLEDYKIYITAENGSLNWDNSLAQDDTITFNPYYMAVLESEAQLDENDHSMVQVLKAEISTSRLVKDWRTQPKVHIEKADGTNLLTFPLIEYGLLFKEHKYSGMSDQEYLDRQDEYNFMFFLQNGGGGETGEYISNIIYINSWRVVLDENHMLG